MKKFCWSWLGVLILFFTPLQAQLDLDDLKDPKLAHAGGKVYFKLEQKSGKPIHLLKTTDFGKTWKTIEPQNMDGSPIQIQGYQVNKMKWLDEQNGYLLTDDMTYVYRLVVYRTFDSGHTWHVWKPELAYSALGAEHFHLIDNQNHFVYLGNRLKAFAKESNYDHYYATTNDGGLNWQIRSLNSKVQPDGEKIRNITFSKSGKGKIKLGAEHWISEDYGVTWALARG